MRIAWGLAVCAALLAVAGCDGGSSASPGSSSASSPASSTSSGRVTLPPNMYGTNPPSTGQCLDTTRSAVVDCNQQHDAEVMSVGKLTATSMPDENTAGTMTMPICRERLAEYLGGPDADATNLVAMPLWPNDQQWKNGERWLLCTVAEVGADEKAQMRTGSLEGALQSQDQFRFQTCSVSSPSRDARIRRGPCDAPHLGEAIPGVISLGRPGGTMPSTESINNIAQQRCPGVLARYLVCYAEAVRPVRVRLRNLGSAKLPS
jgi:hypothetical protein